MLKNLFNRFEMCSNYMRAKLRRLKDSIIEVDFPNDDIFKPGDCIVYDLPALHQFSNGYSQQLWEKYPYGVVEKKICPETLCAVVTDRDTPGNIILSPPPEPNVQPYLLALICQYSVGASIENNDINQFHIKHSKDIDLVAGLRRDTTINRRWCFKKAVSRIMSEAKSNNSIKRIVMPFGIGCNSGVGWSRAGEEEEEWLASYYPTLAHLAHVMKKCKKEFVLVRPKQDGAGKGQVPPQVVKRPSSKRRNLRSYYTNDK